MPMSVNEQLRDAQVLHQAYLERLKNGEARRVRNLVTEVFEDLPGDIIKSSRRKSVLAYLRLTLGTYVDRIQAVAGKLLSAMDEIAKYEAKWQASLLQKTLPVKFDLRTPAPTTLKAASSLKVQDKTVKTWFDGIAKTTTKRAYNEVRVAVVQGEAIPEIADRIARQSTKLTAAQSEALARTSVQEIVTEARAQTYEENSDLMKGIIYIATLDLRTTVQCASLDGKVFPIDSGPRPPLHFNCRSTTAPVLKSWKSLGLPFKESASQRATMDGTVPSTTTYEQWLKRQTPQARINVLGEERARMFNSGKFTLSDFVNSDYQPLTLKELQRLET